MDKTVKQEKDINEINAMIQALDHTGIRMFMYYPQTKTITVPENTCEVYQCKSFYDNMPHSFADDYVHEDDYDIFKEMYYKIDRGEKMATATFHSKDLNYCNLVTLTTVSWTKDGKPKDVFGLIENMSDLYKKEQVVKELQAELEMENAKEEMKDAIKIISEAIGNQYYALYYIYLETNTYLCFQEKIKGKMSLIEEKGDYIATWEAYIAYNIEKETQDKLRKFGDINTLATRIGNKNMISCDYFRQDIGWTRDQFLAGKRDENGKLLTVIFTASDINDEVDTKQKKDQAELEALQDAMTNLWNRKAFDQLKENKNYKNKQLGLILFDIDKFKGINDQFGHETGDQVIRKVAQVVSENMRQKDRVFRIGGDEFAILLHSCNPSIWKTICRKIEKIHTELKKTLPSEMNVTLSAGLYISEKGYCDEMYKLADQAMYNTKTKGRAGCSIVNSEGKIVDEWHDKNQYLRKDEVLEKNSTVTWRMEIPKKKETPIRVYGDESYLKFLGISQTLSPEEIHLAAMKRLEPEYLELAEEAIKATIADGQAEAVYYWNHPEKGRVQLRCDSSLDYETEEYYSIVGYHHIIKDLHVFTLEDINHKIQVALEEMFFCNFYIRLSDFSFTVYKAQPYMADLLENCDNAIGVVDAYIKNVVEEASKEKMKVFLDLTTLRQRMKKVNILAENYKDPHIGPSTITFTVVDRDEMGEVETVALVVGAVPI